MECISPDPPRRGHRLKSRLAIYLKRQTTRRILLCLLCDMEEYPRLTSLAFRWRTKTGSNPRALTPLTPDPFSLTIRIGLATSPDFNSKSIAAMQKNSTLPLARHNATNRLHRCTVSSSTWPQLGRDKLKKSYSKYSSPAATCSPTPSHQISTGPKTPSSRAHRKSIGHCHLTNLFAFNPLL